MDINNNYDKIEAYLNQSLSEADKFSFEQELKKNATLKKAVLNHVLANEALGLAIEDKVSGKLQKLAQQRKEHTTPPLLQVWWKKPLSIAAGILLLLLAGSIIWINQNYATDTLAINGYAESTLPTVRSENEVNPNLTNGFMAFSKKEYAKAYTLLATIPETDTNYLEAQYIAAHAYWQEHKYAGAGALFSSLLSSPNLPQTIDRQELEWNNTLTILQEKGAKHEIFKQAFGAILANPQHSYHQKAIMLSNQLDSFWRNFVILN